jgi:CheY-like chemotaxis protein
MTRSQLLFSTILLGQDYEMPVLDGPSAARVIRDSGCNTYIVGITGNSYRKMLRFFGRVAPMLSFPNPCDTSI